MVTFPVEPDFLMKANKIEKKSPFDDLNNYEKETLWRNRFAVVKLNSLIPKLFLSYDKNSPTLNEDLEKIISKMSCLSVVQAIELLSGKYVNEIEYVVSFEIYSFVSMADVSKTIK